MPIISKKEYAELLKAKEIVDRLKIARKKYEEKNKEKRIEARRKRNALKRQKRIRRLQGLID